MMPKEFIEKVLINEIGEIHEKYPYLSFAMMAVGIEFLGKCLNSFEDWNQTRRSKLDFELAVNSLVALSTYRQYLTSHKLWDSLRNGFAHSFVPKNTLTLSSGKEAAHFYLNPLNQRINLKCENFYSDFKLACEEVIAMSHFPANKMNVSLLTVPSTHKNLTILPPSSGTTSI